MTDPFLKGILLRAASRFVCGEEMPEALEAAKKANGLGHAATIDYMGESTRDEALAERATEEFVRVAKEIKTRGLDSSISLDLSHVGMALDADFAFENASKIARAAREAGTEVMVSMEGTERTDEILSLHERLSESFEEVGITLQAYLHRTESDLAAALERPGRIRLVKGAFEEPESAALPRDSTDLDEAYRRHMETLLASGHTLSIATHDETILDHAHEFIRENGLEASNAEFEMLYGITPERLEAMRERGCRTRVYLVYGEEWYLYLCHRLAEHPPNIYRAVASLGSLRDLTPS
ncbi:MAG: proline dehydrogenase family protein [Rubrobacter sp.]|nr:proline dehydrogenase family protein [Rubrobacter sp.]